MLLIRFVYYVSCRFASGESYTFLGGAGGTVRLFHGIFFLGLLNDTNTESKKILSAGPRSDVLLQDGIRRHAF